MKKLSLICLSLAVALTLAIRAQAQVLIIANPGVKADAVSKSELRDVFTGETKNLKEGGRVMPVLLQGGAAHEAFLNEYIHMSETMMQTCWRRLAFSGQSTMPKSFASEAELVAYIARTSGAIGYVSSATAHDGVKTLTVK
jgi:ABC-type phosphate transport system substrate-binding protein